jgi:hypothetical protein
MPASQECPNVEGTTQALVRRDGHAQEALSVGGALVGSLREFDSD